MKPDCFKTYTIDTADLKSMKMEGNLEKIQVFLVCIKTFTILRRLACRHNYDFYGRTMVLILIMILLNSTETTLVVSVV